MATSSTRQRRPSAEDVTRESNSTASLFLGGARKNWMSSSTQVKPTKPNKPTNPAATSPSFPRQDAPHAMPPPDHTSPPTVPDRPEATLISPVTPRATIQSSGLHEPVATMIAPKVPDPPQLAAAPALPSPVPSTESYPSPVVDQLWMVNSTTAPSPGASTSVRSENPITTAAATTTTTTTTTTTNTTAPGTLNGTASNPSIRSGTAQIPQPSPASTSQETAARVQPVSLLHGSQNRSADGSFPDAQTWALWKSRLNTLKITADNGQLSPYVEPRIGLLYEACNYEDVDYLLLHYLFCRQFAGITSPATEALDTPACRRGLILMSDLLQSNDDLPIVLVRKFCQFPGNPIEMEYEPWYSATVGRIANTLTLLATGFAENPIPVYKELSERRFPFLVSEMKTRFGIRSVCLLRVVFQSLVRQLYPDSSDIYKRLRDLFQRDLILDKTEMNTLSFRDLIDEYRKIPMKTLSPTTASPLSTSTPSVSTPSQVTQAHQLGRAPVQDTCRPSASNQSPVASTNTTALPTNQSHVTHSNRISQQPTPVQQSAPNRRSSSGGHLIPSQQPVPSQQSIAGQTPVPYQQPIQGQQQHYHHRALPPQPYNSPYPHNAYPPQNLQQMQFNQQAVPVPIQQQQHSPHPHPQQSQQQQQYSGWSLVSPTSQGQLGFIPPNGAFRQVSRPGINTGHYLPNHPAHMRQSVQGPPVGYFTPPSGPMATRSPQASAAQQTGPQSAASSAFRPGQTQMGGGPLQDSTVQVRNQAAASPHHQLAPPHHVPSPASLTPQTHLTYPVNYPYLMPPEGYRIPQLAVPDPFRLSMHQIDLLDPIKKCVKSGEPGGHKVEAELFHYFSDFWLGPTEIDPHAYNYEWPLTLTAEDIRRLPRYETLAKEEHRKVITYQTGCRVFRLRCVAIKKIETRDIRDLWPTAPTTWPSCFYIHINGIELTARRKPHNARDLPVDLSMSLKDGENKLQISLLPRDGEFENTRFFFAVEKMEIHSFEMVRGQVQTVPAEKVRQIIRERLNKTAADEDLAVVTENLNVSLIDPFTAQVFTHPARSELCTHLDCFDLETFIRTRKSVSGPASLNDKWTCPICNVDARPQLLKVDRFFEEVRDELVSKNQLEVAQAIKISSNGSWTLQTIQESTPERRSSSQTPLAKRKAGSQRAGSATSRPKIESSSTRTAPSSERVVIELD